MSIYTRLLIVPLLTAVLIGTGCKTLKKETSLAAIQFQKKQQWDFEGIHFSNRFGSARLNGVTRENDSTFRLLIEPENKPINPSPWYAFKIWTSPLKSANEKSVYLTLSYGEAKHRYNPKTSTDGRRWVPVRDVTLNTGKNEATFKVDLRSDTLTVAGQELMGIQHTYTWADSLDRLPYVKKRKIGESILGKPIYALNTPEGSDKMIVAIMGRLHPPEITGYIAMMEFVGELLGNTEQARRFRARYELIIFPMVNPDGIEEGNWRHSVAGVDLNRDWTDFKQPETSAVRDYLLAATKRGKRVGVGMDFHSTFYDVFYTNNEDPEKPTYLSGFMTDWLKAYESAMTDFKANVQPSPSGGKTSKGWLGKALNAEAVTYEVGDRTSREKIRSNARLFAQKMMELLLKK